MGTILTLAEHLAIANGTADENLIALRDAILKGTDSEEETTQYSYLTGKSFTYKKKGNGKGKGRIRLPNNANDYDFVTDRLAVGGLTYNYRDMSTIERGKFTYVVDVQDTFNSGTERLDEMGISYVKSSFGTDDANDVPVAAFYKVARAVVSKLNNPAEIGLVHCMGGMNRGPSMAYFLLRLGGMTKAEAYNAILDNRPCARVYDIAYRWDAEQALKSRRVRILARLNGLRIK